MTKHNLKVLSRDTLRAVALDFTDDKQRVVVKPHLFESGGI